MVCRRRSGSPTSPRACLFNCYFFMQHQLLGNQVSQVNRRFVQEPFQLFQSCTLRAVQAALDFQHLQAPEQLHTRWSAPPLHFHRISDRPSSLKEVEASPPNPNPLPRESCCRGGSDPHRRAATESLFFVHCSQTCNDDHFEIKLEM